MRTFGAIAAFAALVASGPLGAQPISVPSVAVFSNEEQVYFAKEAGKPAPPIVHLRVEGRAEKDALPLVTGLDAFGEPADVAGDVLKVMAIAMRGMPDYRSGALDMGSPEQRIELRRARPATCWVAIKKDKPKADGSPDWYFAQNVKLHDQGGRALVGTGIADTQPVMIRMRNVVWPPKADGTPSTNKPSIVLYVHKPDQYDRSEAYAWGDPGAARIGINLRWVQASCGIDGMEQALAVIAGTFRG